MRTVLVTGASGFVGRQTLQPLLDLGFEVHGVCRQPLTEMPEVHWHAVNLFAPAERQALLDAVLPTDLLHAAWYAAPGQFWRSPENIAWLAASLKMAREFSDIGGERLLTVGSCAEYDWRRTDTQPWKETDSCRPGTLYGETKASLFQVLEKWASEEEISYVHARLFFMFGPHEPVQKLVAGICRDLKAGQPVRCGAGHFARDFMDVRDVGLALAHLLQSDATGPINVASGQATTIGEIANFLGSLAQTPEAIQLGALPNRPDEAPSIVADICKLQEAIAFTPPDLFARLRDTFEQA